MSLFSLRFLTVKLAEIRKEVQCPICLGKDVLFQFFLAIWCPVLIPSCHWNLNISILIIYHLCLFTCLNFFLSHCILHSSTEGEPWRSGKVVALTMRLWVQVMKTSSFRNVGKCCVHKTQSGRTLPRTLRKWELCAPGCPFILYSSTLNSPLISFMQLYIFCVQAGPYTTIGKFEASLFASNSCSMQF
jgi:hypothetical protein